MNQAGMLPVSTPKRKPKTKTDARTERVVHMSDDNNKNEPQVLKQIVIPDSDIQVAVDKTHMAINQFEMYPTGHLRAVSSRSVMMSYPMLIKLNLIMPTISKWIDRCEKTWQESNVFAEKQI